MHYKDKNLQIDIRCHTVFMNDQKIELSLKEFTVLKYLTEHPGWVFSHEEIYRNVWKEEPIVITTWILSSFIKCRSRLFTGVLRILRFYPISSEIVTLQKFGVKIGVK